MRYLLWPLLVFLTLLFSACSGQAAPLPEVQLLTRVWQALEPNTSSHNQANWEVVESKSVSGREVSERFAGEPDPGCVPGPPPPANGRISLDATYWYVQMRPRPATPLPRHVSPKLQFARRISWLIRIRVKSSPAGWGV